MREVVSDWFKLPPNCSPLTCLVHGLTARPPAAASAQPQCSLKLFPS